MRNHRNDDGPVVLFDGVCNLCHGAVRFIIQRDPAAHFRFAPLQSAVASHRLGHFPMPTIPPESIVLIESGKLYSQSTAVLRIARKLTGFWPLVYGFILIPTPIRDRMYDFVAKHRYRWFGHQSTCMVPSPELKHRFLDER